MSDERLRELERRFRASGAVSDEAELLRARTRAGDLDPGRLELAAYLGHEAASRALDQEPGTIELSEPWILGLGRWGDECRARACLALGRLAQAHIAERPDLDDHGRVNLLAPGQILRAFEDWILCPCEPHAVHTRLLNGPCYQLMAFGTGEEGSPSAMAVYSVIYAVRCTNAHDSEGHVEAILRMMREAGATGLLAAVNESLLPWALGHGDPLRARVAARRPSVVVMDDDPQRVLAMQSVLGEGLRLEPYGNVTTFAAWAKVATEAALISIDHELEAARAATRRLRERRTTHCRPRGGKRSACPSRRRPGPRR